MMKKLFLLALLAVCTMGAQSQKQVRLKVNLKGLADQDTLALSWGAINKSMNPLIAQKGATEDCTFNIPLNEPRLVQVSIKGFQGQYEMLVSPNEEIELTGRIRKDNTLKKPEIFFQRVHVSGAALQSGYQNLIRTYNQHLDSLDNSIINEYKDVTQLMEKAKDNNDEQAIADMYNTVHGQSYIERVMSTYDERQDFLRKMVLDQKDTFMGPLLLLRLAGRLDKSYRPIYDKMSEAAKQCYYGREVNDEVNPPTLLDDLAPTLKLVNPKGEEELLALAQHSNKYLLIDFWASWCEPCRKEIPNLKRLYEKYHAKGLEMVSISADHNMEDWLTALDEIDEPWKNYLDKSRQGIAEYKVQYIPSIFIVDSDGKIIAEKLRGKDLSDFVDKLFQ